MAEPLPTQRPPSETGDLRHNQKYQYERVIRKVAGRDVRFRRRDTAPTGIWRQCSADTAFHGTAATRYLHHDGHSASQAEGHALIDMVWLLEYDDMEGGGLLSRGLRTGLRTCSRR